MTVVQICTFLGITTIYILYKLNGKKIIAKILKYVKGPDHW